MLPSIALCLSISYFWRCTFRLDSRSWIPEAKSKHIGSCFSYCRILPPKGFYQLAFLPSMYKGACFHQQNVSSYLLIFTWWMRISPVASSTEGVDGLRNRSPDFMCHAPQEREESTPKPVLSAPNFRVQSLCWCPKHRSLPSNARSFWFGSFSLAAGSLLPTNGSSRHRCVRGDPLHSGWRHHPRRTFVCRGRDGQRAGSIHWRGAGGFSQVL